MNYTNFTTDKPEVYEQPSASTFGSGRDIAYLVFSILQFGITVFTLIWVNYIIRKKDKKDEKERLEKEERDKIADIINNEYNKIVEYGIHENFRKCKSKFQTMVMFYGSAWETRGRKYKITGLDVLRFMLRNPYDFGGGPLEKLQQDLDAVVRLFRSLRIKLPLKGDCPIHIKEELGPLITDVGEIARFLVSGRKRYTISNVLKYFGNYREEVRSIGDEENKDDDDSRKIRRILPYLNRLPFGIGTYQMVGDKIKILEKSTYHDQDFSFEISSIAGAVGTDPKKLPIITSLENIKCELYNITKPIKAEYLRSFADKIDAIWRRKFQQLPMPDWSKEEHLRANILHAVYVFMFKVEEDSDIIQDEKFKKLVGEMRDKIYAQYSYLQKDRSGRAIGVIQRSIDHLTSLESAYLCEQESIADILERVSKDINYSIRQTRQALNNP